MLDFRQLNFDLSPLQVLAELGLTSTYCSLREWRGRCPISHCRDRENRCFDLDLVLHRWHCHRCRKTGDLIDLWARLRDLSTYDAAWELARRFRLTR